RMVAPAARPSRKGRLALFRWTPAKQVWRAHIDRFPFGQPVTCPVGASGHQNSVGASAGVDGERRLVVLPDGTAVAALVDSVAASPSVAERRPDGVAVDAEGLGEVGDGDDDAAAEADALEVAAPDELVGGGATDAEDLAGLLDGEGEGMIVA